MRRPPSTPLVDQLPNRQRDSEPTNHLAEEVQKALRRLRDEYRQAFLLFHEQELSYAQIGAVLGCPLGTVKTWVHRARRELIAVLRKRGTLEVSHAMRRI
jgi:RNA polymerase sigma-70 factor (ECF subfamily)